MPKINVYLPDDLADAVRETGVPVSAICQRALEVAVKRISAIRQSAAADLLAEGEDPAGRLRLFTARAVKAVQLGIEHAHGAGAANVSTGDLLTGMLAEGGNLALQILTALEIDPATLIVPVTPAETGGDGSGLRFSSPAAAVLEATVAEAAALGHNYVGCEHLLVALASNSGSLAGRALQNAGADAKSVRRAVIAALVGYEHLRNTLPSGPTGGLLTAVRQELQPLIERIERLEARN
jgi:ATP-dependent Clp protease ATP-binding subunit ClpA